MKKKKNLSEITFPKLNHKRLRIVVITSEWNSEITHELEKGCINTLKEAGIEKIETYHVPGSYELPQYANMLIEHNLSLNQAIDAVICLGCVIKGETPHFDYISSAVSHGIMNVSLKFNIPVIFGVLTTLNMKQAKERAGGKYGNKGIEAAATALCMIYERQKLL
ncbi:MAG: 6,7-dimethyl-8-ribityllumazine synthase [Bacteroidales bacterium]|nr:6,7-dimethyl-8-ribityllumazine synthase [Bacteroidales bacterium]